jgi:hypothetical protein
LLVWFKCRAQPNHHSAGASDTRRVVWLGCVLMPELLLLLMLMPPLLLQWSHRLC